MELTDHPDHVIRHEPLGCRKCGTGQAGARQTGAGRRQVTEIPPVKAEVTEHQMIEMECPCCGERSKADATDGVTAPVQYGPRASRSSRLWLAWGNGARLEDCPQVKRRVPTFVLAA